MGVDGSTEIDAPLAADHPEDTDGVGPDAGSGGSEAGGTGGIAGVTGKGGSGAGGAGGIAGATGKGGAGGQTGSGGTVGAEVPDAAPGLDSSSPDAPCALCSIGAALIHRYNFNGTGTRVTDSVGTAHGTVVNAQLSGSGALALSGGDQYVDLPDRILSTLTSATLEIWVTWAGGNNNQRILDFGSNELVNGKYRATTTMIVSPNSAPEGIAPRLRTSYSNSVSLSGTFVDAQNALATGTIKQVVAVLDGQGHTISMYVDGVLQGQTTGLGALSAINDTNNWLGKSQYSDDPGFSGTYHEFRIYNAPLTAAQVQAVFAAGQNASFSQ